LGSNGQRPFARDIAWLFKQPLENAEARSASGLPGEAAEGIRTLDLLHGKQTL
jgi:hypothetical protein